LASKALEDLLKSFISVGGLMQRREPATYHSGCSGTPLSQSLLLPSNPRITEKRLQE